MDKLPKTWRSESVKDSLQSQLTSDQLTAALARYID